MKREANLFERSLIYIIPFTVVFALILYFITKNEDGQVKSLVVGVIASIVLNYWHTATTQNLSNKNYAKLKRFTIFSYIFRYTIYAGLLIVGVLFSDFNPIFMVFGFLEYPVIMMVVSLVSVNK